MAEEDVFPPAMRAKTGDGGVQMRFRHQVGGRIPWRWRETPPMLAVVA